MTLPNSITSIRRKAFARECRRAIVRDAVRMVRKVYNDLCNPYICDDLSADCSGITDLTLPDSITTIESEAFAGKYRRGIHRLRVRV